MNPGAALPLSIWIASISTSKSCTLDAGSRSGVVQFRIAAAVAASPFVKVARRSRPDSSSFELALREAGETELVSSIVTRR